MTMMTNPTTPAVPEWIDLDRIVSPELRAELAAITAEYDALEPQLESIGRRAHDAHMRAEAAIRDATAALDGADFEIESHDGTSSFLAALSGAHGLFDAALRVTGHLAAWTSCAPYDPAWLTEADARMMASVGNGQESPDTE